MESKAFLFAEYILQKQGPLMHMYLHKLLYLSKAWWLASTRDALFGSPIFASVYGPVVDEVYKKYKRNFVCEPEGLDLTEAFHDDQIFFLETSFVDKLLSHYCKFDNIDLGKEIMADGVWWSAYKTMEPPSWINAQVLMDVYSSRRCPFLPLL